MSYQTASAVQFLNEEQFRSVIVRLFSENGWLVTHTRSAKGSGGSPDLLVIKSNNVLFMELKTDKGRIGENQKDWISQIPIIHNKNNYSISGLVVRPKDFSLVSDIAKETIDMETVIKISSDTVLHNGNSSKIESINTTELSVLEYSQQYGYSTNIIKDRINSGVLRGRKINGPNGPEWRIVIDTDAKTEVTLGDGKPTNCPEGKEWVAMEEAVRRLGVSRFTIQRRILAGTMIGELSDRPYKKRWFVLMNSETPAIDAPAEVPSSFLSKLAASFRKFFS
jgi:hypothetical protein